MTKSDQTFEVNRKGTLVRLPLSALSADEILGLANGFLRAGLKDKAQPLYRLQHAMLTRTLPPPGSDAA